VAWLYDLVTADERGRAPQFAEQSSLNWVAALHFEVEREHGKTTAEQVASCRALVESFPRVDRKDVRIVAIYEALFRGITNVLSLQRLAQIDGATAWHRPSATVTWYYSLYASVAALFAAIGQPVSDNHMAASRTFANSWQSKSPHPSNMVALQGSGETYDLQLPTYRAATKHDIRDAFVFAAPAAQGIILSYLSGTCDWYADRTKTNVLRANKQITNFRTAKAKMLRDAALEKRIGFMHCAYRYRGKANYRDGVFLTYSPRELAVAATFLTALGAISRFMLLFTLIAVESIRGTRELHTFLEDVEHNLRGAKRLSSHEAFWRHLRSAEATA
jgi:hypothetical protein